MAYSPTPPVRLHRECEHSCSEWWLARKDSNLRSPDPESGDRSSRFLARLEHETHRFLASIFPSVVTSRKRGQVATSGSPDPVAQQRARPIVSLPHAVLRNTGMRTLRSRIPPP